MSAPLQLHYIRPFHPADLEPWFILEAVLLCLNLTVMTCFIVVLSRVHMHQNLKILSIYTVSMYFPSILARFLILALQSSVLEQPEDPNQSRLVIVCSFFRIYHMVLCITLPDWLFIERKLALVYVQDYEQKKRLWIAVSVIALCVVFVGSVTIIYIFNILTWNELSFPVCILGLIGALLFFHLVWKSKELERELSKIGRKSSITYTLSLRFQLAENLWSSTLIRNAIITCGMINSTGLLSYLAAKTPMAIEYLGEEKAQYMDQVFNLCIAINGPLAVAGTVFYNEYLMNLVRTTFCGSAKSNETTDVGQVYFKQLHTQWNRVEEEKPKRRMTRVTTA